MLTFSRHHVFLAGMLLGVVLVTLGLLPSGDVEAKRIALSREESAPEPAPPTAPITATETPKPTATTTAATEIEDIAWERTKVRRGENLSLVFQRLGLSPRDVYLLTQAAGSARELTRLYPGQALAVHVDGEQKLQAMQIEMSRLHQIRYDRDGEAFSRSETIREPETRAVYRHAQLENSLFLSGAKAGLPDGVIMELANIFSGVIDFVLDPRRGDTFAVLYEERWLDGEKIGNGSILAAEYINDGKPFAAFRFTDSHGDSGYFDEQGVSMQKAFLRAPLDFTRISSNFSLRRKHPVHKRIKAHRGVDYAAPTGTPVYAAGDGRVVAAGYSRANGNYVFVQHGEKYTTKYLHLSKRKVKKGQRVKQKQTIGLVGATGLATGPHLHYEFLVNGVHRNPRTIIDQLPRAKSIDATERSRFETAITPYRQQLASYRQAWLLAQVDGG